MGWFQNPPPIPLMIMIELTKLNGQSFTLNAIYIEQMQAFPDTTITLTNGRKFVVKENEQEVRRAVNEFYKSISILGAPIHKEVDW